MQVCVREEQLLPIELHSVRETDVADVTAWTDGAERLPHRLRRADALEHRIGADSLRDLLDSRHAVLASLRHDVGSPEFAGEPLSHLMAAHGDDALGTHLLGR